MYLMQVSIIGSHVKLQNRGVHSSVKAPAGNSWNSDSRIMFRLFTNSRTSSSRHNEGKCSTSRRRPNSKIANLDGPPILPPELIDPIIDEVARSNDIQTLRACALVNSTFVFRAQSHLFRTVDLDKRTPRQTYYHRFHSLLVVNPRLGVHVRHFRLGDDSEDDYGCESSSWVTTSTTLAETLTLLSRLESFSLTFNSELMDWHAISSPTRCAIARIFSLPTLKAVSLDFISSLPPQLLIPLTRIQYLELSSVNVDDSVHFSLERVSSAIYPSSRDSGLRSLVLKGTSPRTVQIILCSLIAISSATLQRLSVTPTFEVGFCNAIGDLMKSRAGINISSFDWMPTLHLSSSMGPVDIACLPHLRSLKFLVSFRDSQKGPFRQAIRFLNQLSFRPNRIQSIVFECHFLQLPCRFTTGGVLRREVPKLTTKSTTNFNVEAWHHLDKVLLNPAFRELKKVEFELPLSSSMDMDQYRAEMAFRDLNLFPGIRHKGVTVAVLVQSGKNEVYVGRI